MKPRVLSVGYMSYKGYTQYIMYDFVKWIEKHYGDDKDPENIQAVPSFSITAPRLFSREYSEEELKTIMKTDLRTKTRLK